MQKLPVAVGRISRYRFGLSSDNYLVDNASYVIVGVQATAARMSQETVAAQDMITCFAAWQASSEREGPTEEVPVNYVMARWIGAQSFYSVWRKANEDKGGLRIMAIHGQSPSIGVLPA